MAALGDENVCRLDVPMNDSLGMRRVQRVCHFDRQRKNLLHLPGTSPDPAGT
jgi:hypothetical protein